MSKRTEIGYERLDYPKNMIHSVNEDVDRHRTSLDDAVVTHFLEPRDGNLEAICPWSVYPWIVLAWEQGAWTTICHMRQRQDPVMQTLRLVRAVY